jgi:hypothetical protein
MKRWIIMTLAVALILPFWAATAVVAQDSFVDENGDGIDDTSAFMHRKGMGRHGMRGGSLSGDVLWTSTALTDDQSTAIQTKVQEMKDAGATFEEVRAAEAEMLAGYGITIGDGTPWRMGRGGVWTGTELTDEQQAAIQAEVDRLEEEGATRDAIKAATAEMLAGYGYTVSEDANWRLSYSPFARMSMRLGSVLSEEALAGLEAKIEALKADGLTREEMRDAVQTELAALGVEMPERGDRGTMGRRGGRRGGRR